MKSQINPVVAVILIVVVVAVAGFLIWRGSQGVNTGSGRLKSDLDFSKMEKDPVKLQQGIQELLRKEQQEKAGKK